MKFTLSLIFSLLFAIAATAQVRSITQAEYDNATRITVSQSQPPFTFTVVTQFLKNGKVTSTVTEIDENESQERERITRTTVTGTKTLRSFQIVIGSDNYCSEDGVRWKAPTPYMCHDPVSFYGRRKTRSVKCTVQPASQGGNKLYREYSVYPPLRPNGKREFRDELSVIDSHGRFVSVVTTEGTLAPRSVKLIRKQSWQSGAAIKPIVSPGR